MFMSVFDIETGARPEAELRAMLPAFDPDIACPKPGPWDDSMAKVPSNWKDEKKIAAKIDEAREIHFETVQQHPKLVEAAREQHWSRFVEKAALDPAKGRVLAVGIKSSPSEDVIMTIDDGGEQCLIENAWLSLLAELSSGEKIIGHNIFGFDLPFLFKRSWILEVDIPDWVRNGRYWNPAFVDIMEEWFIGQRGGGYVSVDDLCKIFGIPGKPDGLTGADFDRLFHGTSEERDQAIEYLRNDLVIEWGLAERMQLI